VTQATLSYDLILYFWISTSWSPVVLQISSWLVLQFWRYCCYKIKHFGWKMHLRANFWRFLGILTPLNCDIVVLTHKGIQLLQKHAFWCITRQNRSNGLTPSCAKEWTKKAQTINMSPLRGSYPLNRLTCHLVYWMASQT